MGLSGARLFGDEMRRDEEVADGRQGRRAGARQREEELLLCVEEGVAAQDEGKHGLHSPFSCAPLHVTARPD